LESEREGVKSVSVEENKRLAREAIKILTTGDLDAADALYASDYVNHQHHDPEDPRDLHGVQAMKNFAKEFRQAFPNFHDSIDIQLAEADMVATRFTSMGTHRGAFMGVEPTNRELTWTGHPVCRTTK
jgi:predicted ester cyclase